MMNWIFWRGGGGKGGGVGESNNRIRRKENIFFFKNIEQKLNIDYKKYVEFFFFFLSIYIRTLQKLREVAASYYTLCYKQGKGIDT